jgi:hypothetical protein
VARGNRGNPNPSPLTRWQPGQSGNPSGRPAGESFAAVLRELLDREHRRAPNWRAAVAAKAIQMAAGGDLDAMKWIADRTDGKVTEQQDVTLRGDKDAPAVIREVLVERVVDAGDRGA